MDSDTLTALAVVLWAACGIAGMCWSFKHHCSQPSIAILGWVCGGPLVLMGYACYTRFASRRPPRTTA